MRSLRAYLESASALLTRRGYRYLLKGYREKLFTGNAGKCLDCCEVFYRHLFPLAYRGGPLAEVIGQSLLSATIRFEVVYEHFHAANFSQNEISVKKNFQSDAMV